MAEDATPKETILKSRLVHCSKTTAQWASNGTKVGKKGELLLEIIDSNHFKVKVGDGVTAYSALPYLGEKWGDVVKIYNIDNTSKATTAIANGDTLEQALNKIQANLNTLNDKTYVTYSDETPQAPTDAGSAGKSDTTSVSRGDHSHPKQTDSYVNNGTTAGTKYSLAILQQGKGTKAFTNLYEGNSGTYFQNDKLTATLSDETTWDGLKVGDFAQLEKGGKLSVDVIPDSVLGQLEYIGTWNATTGAYISDTRPAISSTDATKRDYRKGDYYIVKTDGDTLPDKTKVTEALDKMQVGDWLVYNGTTWDKIDNTDYIKTVATVAPTKGNIDAATLVTELNKQSITATTLKTKRVFSLKGDVVSTDKLEGSTTDEKGVYFDGSGNVTLNVEIGNGKVTNAKILSMDSNKLTQTTGDVLILDGNFF